MNCKKAALLKYGVRPRNYLSYIDSPKESALVEAVQKYSSEEVSPEFLYSVMMGEGLNQYFDQGGSRAERGEARVSGYHHIGLDQFGSDVERLKTAGYLRNDFDGYTLDPRPENDALVPHPVLSANFKDLPHAVEATAAELEWRRAEFYKDAYDLLGEEGLENLTLIEVDYWNYVYFNAGLKNGRNMLKKRGTAVVKKWRGNPEGEEGGYSHNAHSNSLVRLATTEYIRCIGVFQGKTVTYGELSQSD